MIGSPGAGKPMLAARLPSTTRGGRREPHAESKMIRHLSVALLAGIGLLAAAPASAQISQYPFCIQGVDNPGWSGCSFNTLQACQAAASGTEAECLSNPWYQPGAASAGPPPATAPIGANDPLPVGPPPE